MTESCGKHKRRIQQSIEDYLIARELIKCLAENNYIGTEAVSEETDIICKIAVYSSG